MQRSRDRMIGIVAKCARLFSTQNVGHAHYLRALHITRNKVAHLLRQKWRKSTDVARLRVGEGGDFSFATRRISTSEHEPARASRGLLLSDVELFDHRLAHH